MTVDIDHFVERFARFGAEPSVERYMAFFHPDATLFDSGMARPLTVPEIPAHIEGILKLVPDFRMTPERWRFREPTLFVEAHNCATLAGAPIEWRSIYCIDLKGDQAIRGRRYYDRRPLFARLSPDLAKRTPFDPGPEPFGTVLPATPPIFASLRRRIPDVALELLCAAGDDTLLMREWEVRGTLEGRPLRFGIADRGDLAAGKVAAAHAYFDTLVLV